MKFGSDLLTVKAMGPYRSREVAKLIGLSPAQLRRLVRSGVVDPERGERDQWHFAFQDLVLLRTASRLMAARLPERQVKRSLNRLRSKVPRECSISGMALSAVGDRVVVREQGIIWQADSGQVLFNFDSQKDPPPPSAPLLRWSARGARRSAPSAPRGRSDLDAQGWYEWGYELEETDPLQAEQAYRRTLDLDPSHVAAHLNLGRMLHQAGHAAPAEKHYRAALAAAPQNAIAAFNLGVAMEDQGGSVEALENYLRALRIDPGSADAHFNAARLCQQLGRRNEALRHLHIYRHLTK